MNTECVFCFMQSASHCCTRCTQMARTEKFARLPQYLEACSKGIMYHDAIVSAVQRIRQVKLLE